MELRHACSLIHYIYSVYLIYIYSVARYACIHQITHLIGARLYTLRNLLNFDI